MRTVISTALVSWLLLSNVVVTAQTPAARDPLEVVKGMYAAFDRGDMQAVLDSVSKDITWTQYGPEYALPFAGVFRGRAGVADFFKKVDDYLTDVHAGQREFLVSGNHVTVPGWEESTVRATGGHYRVNNVHEFTVVNGKITQFEEYIDNADVLEAFQPADLERGKALFTTCAGCHGNEAQGRPAMHAPNLTGLGSEYVIKELRHFAAGVRGSETDPYGFMMIGRSRALPGDRGIRDVAGYIETLPPQTSPAAAKGNAERGRSLYAPCAACHGTNAEGLASVGGPPLRQQDATYLRTQLNHFQSDIRGAKAADIGGQQMRAVARTLTDARSIDDVVAYIKSR